MQHNKNKNNNVQQDNLPSFIRTQHQFTQYIRDPKNSPRPTDIEERRMNLYRDFLFTNVFNMLGDGFPVLKKISTEQQWESICRDFFAKHSCYSPYFSDVSQEFIQYLQNERPNCVDADSDFSFLLELAHYEWVELVISIAEDEAKSAHITDPLNQILTVSSTALALAYTYPVHKISPDFLLTEAPEQPTYLMVYRDTDNGTGFLETNPVTHALLIALTDNTERTISEILSELAVQLQHPNPDVVMRGGLTILDDFINRGLIICANSV